MTVQGAKGIIEMLDEFLSLLLPPELLPTVFTDWRVTLSSKDGETDAIKHLGI
jgi:hypothetical protein